MKTGQSFAHYSVAAKIGAGGMGEVFRASDSRLNRDVALKVLPDFFASDTERLARFKREAQVLASLNHPGIAAIYGLESQDGTHALAMELVDGPDLSERLEAGPLPVDEALQYATQIAEAMEAAHEKGVIHRDLKPANVKITPEGRVKILDFGLAKALVDEPEDSGLDPLMSPTMTANMTQAGVILGTAAYMSPEQARGKAADHRADIWAFGALLYEMLSGKRLFGGETISDSLAAILRAEPDWSALPTGLDPAVKLVLRRCLERQVTDRLQSMGDARILLGETMAGTEKEKSPGGVSKVFVYGLAAVLLASLAFNLMNLKSGGPGDNVSDEAQVQHLAASLAPRAPLARARVHPLGIGRPTLTISPDGTQLVYVAEVAGETKLFKKRFDAAQAEEIHGTEGGFHPVFSPGGEWIAYFTQDRLRKVLYAGSEPVTLCEVRNPMSLNWESDSSILVSMAEGDIALRVETDSGQGTVAANVTNMGHLSLLPGHETYLAHQAYLTGINPDSWRVGTYNLEDGSFDPILDGGFSPRYVPTGHLVYARGGNLMGVAFDLDKLETRGRPVPIIAGLRIARRSLPSYDFSANGTLVYVSGPPQTLSKLVWADRQGAVTPLPIPPQFLGDFQISPDGRFVAATVGGDRNDIWIYSVASGTRRKLTTDGDGMYPIWSPDGQRMAFASSRDGRYGCYIRPVDASEPARPVEAGDKNGSPYAWLPTNEIALYDGKDIHMLDLDNNHLVTAAGTTATEWGPGFSPDGRWMAYTSDESGRYEIYVKPYPELSGAWAVSSDGGEEPVWGRDGKTLYYRNGDTWLEAAVEFEPGFQVGKPRVVLEGPFINVPGRSFDVSPDGSRFLVILDEGNEEFSRHVEVVLNWFDELERLVPTQ